MNKFIWQSNNGYNGQLDYLLIDDKTLSHYENPEQDQGVLARIIPTVRKGHKNYRVFIEENLTLFGNTSWYYLNQEDLEEEEINNFDDEKIIVKDFASLREARDYVEKYWDRRLSESPTSLSLEEQYSDERLNLFRNYVRSRRSYEEHEKRKEKMEKEEREKETESPEHQLVNEFLTNLESKRFGDSGSYSDTEPWTLDSIWKVYEEDDRRLGQSYDKYKKRINETRYDE